MDSPTGFLLVVTLGGVLAGLGVATVGYIWFRYEERRRNKEK